MYIIIGRFNLFKGRRMYIIIIRIYFLFVNFRIKLFNNLRNFW